MKTYLYRKNGDLVWFAQWRDASGARRSFRTGETDKEAALRKALARQVEGDEAGDDRVPRDQADNRETSAGPAAPPARRPNQQPDAGPRAEQGALAQLDAWFFGELARAFSSSRP